MRGWIALDIDGTITDKAHMVPAEVATYLESLQKNGWNIVFLTGRTFSFAMKTLDSIYFPYLLGVQNGADVIEMPSRKSKSRTYLSSDIIESVEALCRHLHEDFLIYTGYERGDFCYYRTSRFSAKMLEYIEVLKTLSKEPWKKIEQFPLNELHEFPLIKCFGTEEQMRSLQPFFDAHAKAQATMIRDPMIGGLYLQLITSKLAGKGKTLQRIVGKKTHPIIAAGDDGNDIEMLEVADVKIVMETAPKSMHGLADILAKPAKHMGIIAALEQAIQKVHNE